MVSSAAPPAKTERLVSSVAAPAKSERLANVERLRILCMLEIVHFHDADDRLPVIAGLGLPGFLLLNNAFNCTLTERRGFRRFLRDKVDRLLVPWLFWNVIYGALLVASAAKNGRPLFGELQDPSLLLTGTYSHLWFVPFALLSALLVAGAHYATRAVRHELLFGVALGLGLLCIPAANHLLDYDFANPFPAWLIVSPTVLFGFAFGRALLIPDAARRRRLSAAVAIGSAVTWIALASAGVDFQIYRHFGALFLIGLGFATQGSSDWITRNVPPLLFGIYLVHPLIARYLMQVPIIGTSEWMFVVDFLVTAGCVWLMRKTPLKKVI